MLTSLIRSLTCLVIINRMFSGSDASSELILAPNATNNSNQTNGIPVAFILLIGANIAPSDYYDLGIAIQTQYDGPLWFAAPSFIDNMPDPLQATEKISDIIGTMQSKYGLPTSYNNNPITLFISGHSLGGAVCDTWTFENQFKQLNSNNPSSLLSKYNVLYSGQILMGSFIQRKYRYYNGTQLLNYNNYTVPTLTISGELDGLCRVSRIIEQFYIQNYYNNMYLNDSIIANYPVIVVNGMTHGQFANEQSELPHFVDKYDLKPEITYQTAHNTVAQLITAFMNLQLSGNAIKINKNTLKTGNIELIRKYIDSTIDISLPFIDAFIEEGFYHFVRPCDCKPQICPTIENVCNGGSPWSKYVTQKVMASLPSYSKATVNNTDSFHIASQINPVHLPHVYNNCSDPNNTVCSLNTTTVTQNIYSEFDSEDTGFYITAAKEQRVKITSRQRVWIHAGYSNIANFNVTDGPPYHNCGEINERALSYALSNAPNRTLNRYYKYGTQLHIGTDIGPLNAGPLFIDTPLQFRMKYNVSYNKYDVWVRSPFLLTPEDYWIRPSAGFHYCKVLSPARVMEWLYTDSLRSNLSIINDTVGLFKFL